MWKDSVEHLSERHCEPANKSSTQLKQAETLCIDDHQMNPDDSKVIVELASVCAQIVPQMLVLGKNWPPRHSLDSEYVGSSCHKMEPKHAAKTERSSSATFRFTKERRQYCFVGDEFEKLCLHRW